MAARWQACALALVGLLALAGCGAADEPASPEVRQVVLVGQSSTEVDVVTELYRLLLEQQGYRTRVEDLGPRDLYLPELRRGEVQLAADYLGSLTDALRRATDGDDAPSVATNDPTATLATLERLARPLGLAPLAPARAEDVRSFAVTRTFARRYDLATLSDLGRLPRRVTLAADTECATRDDCGRGLTDVYGVRLARIVPVGIDGGDTLEMLLRGDVQVAQVAATDGRLGRDVVLLQDDRDLQDAQQVVPVANLDWLRTQPRVRTELARLADVLTTSALRSLNADVDLRGTTPRAAAQAWLEEEGLL